MQPINLSIWQGKMAKSNTKRSMSRRPKASLPLNTLPSTLLHYCTEPTHQAYQALTAESTQSTHLDFRQAQRLSPRAPPAHTLDADIAATQGPLALDRHRGACLVHLLAAEQVAVDIGLLRADYVVADTDLKLANGIWGRRKECVSQSVSQSGCHSWCCSWAGKRAVRLQILHAGMQGGSIFSVHTCAYAELRPWMRSGMQLACMWYSHLDWSLALTNVSSTLHIDLDNVFLGTKVHIPVT